MTKHPSVALRNHLRTLLRTHRDAQTILKGRNVSSLTKSELMDGLRTLGVQPSFDAQDLQNAHITQEPEDDTPYASEDDTQDVLELDTQDNAQDDTEAQAVEHELSEIRRLVMQGGFVSLDGRLRDLVVAARKPPVEVRIEVPVEVPASPQDNGTTIPQAKHTTRTVMWRDAFGVLGTLGDRTSHLWDGAHPDTPKVDPRYVWPQPATAAALVTLNDKKNVFLGGPAGTGKTQWAIQLAATLRRPISIISCDAGTDAATLTGMTAPSPDGGTRFLDGQLTRAIRTPGCIVLIDEPSIARAGALFLFQNVLENRMLTVAETGERIPVAPGVLFIAADNTMGEGGGAREGYTDTVRLNRAFMDRFMTRIAFGYLPPDVEAKTLVSYVPGCPLALAETLVAAAATTRAMAVQESLSRPIGFRRLIGWATLLVAGIDPAYAFQCAILNASPAEDHEALQQQCRLSYDPDHVAQLIASTPNHN